MKCPVCSDARLVISDRQGIEIDYCPECRGVWLDRGELDKIIERSSLPAASQRPSYNDRDSKKHEYNKKTKRGSLLGELFDF